MKAKFIVLMLGLLAISASAFAQRAGFGISLSDGKVRAFHLDVGNYYGYPQRDFAYFGRQGIHEDEIPVVLFIAHRSGYAPARIISMRRRGASWYDISIRCGISPSVYNIQGSGPRGRGWGYWKKHRQNYRHNYYSDASIIGAVNVGFLTNRFHCHETDVTRMRSAGMSYAGIYSQMQAPQRRHYDRDGDHDNGYDERYDRGDDHYNNDGHDYDQNR